MSANECIIYKCSLWPLDFSMDRYYSYSTKSLIANFLNLCRNSTSHSGQIPRYRKQLMVKIILKTNKKTIKSDNLKHSKQSI